MERIARLLFATTALFLFCVLLIYSFVDSAGNGGEYWGFDGHIEPWRAAQQSFEAGENRFLAYELTTEFRGTIKSSPKAYRCDFHPPIKNGHVRFNQIPAKRGYDSVRKADWFAHEYNDSLAALLSYEERYWCAPEEAE